MNSSTLSGRTVLLILVGVGCGLLLLAEIVARQQDYLVNNDFFTFWLGGRMIASGEDPYAEQQWLANHDRYGSTWYENPIYPYPLPLTYLFIPLGLLPLRYAAVMWVWLSEIMILISTWLLMLIEKVPRQARYILPVLAGLVLWRPVQVTLRNGQLGAWLLLLIVLVIYLWNRRRWFSGGLLLALTALKPTIGLPLIGLTGLWLFVRRVWKAILGIILMIGGLFIVGWLRDPQWISKMLWIGSRKLATVWGYNPTTWGMGGVVCNNAMPCTLYVGAGLSLVLVLAALLALLRHARERKPAFVVSIIVPVVVLVTPYLWVYDQILLIVPLILIMGVGIRRGWPYLATALLFPGAAILSLLLLVLAFQLGHDSLSALLPLSVWLMVIIFGRERVMSPESRNV